ncbi:MAG TPA: hypothetical protein VE596_01390 [Gaiellaceae bacterium]|jgi:hypothetical protein|nr:hypothetical protein [Gaiellaceae bacterium]
MNWLERLVEAFVRWVERCIPAYDPQNWADGIQFTNNCYNYACAIRTDTWAQPGRATGHMYSFPIDCAGIDAAARSDGLRPLDCDRGCGCRDCCYKVALAIAPGEVYNDFNWYRLDRDGYWSHKPGWTVTNLDNSGNPITDPRTADRGPYTVFCGCYCVCQGQVTIS